MSDFPQFHSIDELDGWVHSTVDHKCIHDRLHRLSLNSQIIIVISTDRVFARINHCTGIGLRKEELFIFFNFLLIF